MKSILYSLTSSIVCVCFCMQAGAQQLAYPPPAPAWKNDSLGNHRAVVTVTGRGEVARVVIPWNRTDSLPEKKAVFVQDANTGKLVAEVYLAHIGKASGDIRFRPVSGPGVYYLYYLPFRLEGHSSYPATRYLQAAPQPLSAWQQKALAGKSFTPARFDSIQARSDFDAFGPMEQPASDAAIAALLNRVKGQPFLVFPEDRERPIRMRHALPRTWTERKPGFRFSGNARPGEHFSFQLGVFPVKRWLRQVEVEFSDLEAAGGSKIPASLFNCINTGGTTYLGTSFQKRMDIPGGEVQALWCLAALPASLAPGSYKGTVRVKAEAVTPVEIPLEIVVSGSVSHDGGVDEPWKQTRLTWLNSTRYQENTVIPPYIPLEVEKQTIRLLGRSVTLNTDGLPAEINSYFSPEMTRISSAKKAILASPMRFEIIQETGGKEDLTPGNFRFTEKSPGTVSWEAISRSETFELQVEGRLEFDGFVHYRLKLTALNDIALSDTRMLIPFHPGAAQYMLGLGQKGGERPGTLDWKWDVKQKNQDGAWIGNVNGGLQFSLRDSLYERPLNTNFYLQKPLHLPASWGNDNKGGVAIRTEKGGALVAAYSGPRHLSKGKVLYYDFTLLITPFHTLDTDVQWSHRFYHSYKPVDAVEASGSNVVNIHHATFINPYINYPFIAWKEMRAYADSLHRKGKYMKIYNTVRELSNRAYELFPLRSLGHEVFSAGQGGGASWLREHLEGDYIAAWYVPSIRDASIINSGMNRWHNYYVEGTDWLVRKVGIDGIYLDDVAFDRITMKRIKRALLQDGHPGIIDLHSANQFNPRDGFNNSANLYMEHFPYINRLWFGEYFDYEKNGPDFYLTEISGIPFGLMGEMLQDGGNPWRGMLYGMTNRYPYGRADPRGLWKLWDQFGMQGSEMIGYWAAAVPVRTGNNRVLSTVYKRKDRALVALASWEEININVQLEIDWKSLGIDPAKAEIRAHAIPGFQPEARFEPGQKIPVAPAQGWVLWIEEKK